MVLRNKKTFLVPLEAGTLPTGLTAEGNLFVPRGSVCKRKTELSAEKETMSVWGNLGQCFQIHCLRFKPIWLLKKPQ